MGIDMTKAIIHPGNCGFTVTVTAKKGKGKKISVSLDTECEMIKNMERDIARVDMKTIFTNYLNNPVYRSASKHLKHVSCPVVSGILKVIEVETGLSLPQDVSIVFSKD